ncbi:MAG TPA: pseudouridine synthase [Spirochaetia bacterium]|nr:pseudouridine synthase [Spirochaetia bacterium]
MADHDSGYAVGKMALTTLFQDDYIVVVDKPPGLMIHPNAYDWKSPTCMGLVERMTGRKAYTVHRLDRGTSGVVILALNPEVAAAFSLAFRERRVEKRYLALVRGYTDEEGLVDSPISRTPDSSEAPALTLYRTLSRVEIPVPIGPHQSARYSLLALDLKTGRRHQARRHVQRINHPVIGDKRHGDRNHNNYFHERFGREYLFLRAVGVSFQHPVTGLVIDAWAGIPEFWQMVLGELGLEIPAGFAPGPRILQTG